MLFFLLVSEEAISRDGLLAGRVEHSEKVVGKLRFCDIGKGPGVRGSARHVRGVVLTDNQYARLGKFLANLLRGFQTVYILHADVHQDNVWSEFLGCFHRFQPVRSFATDLPFGPRFQQGSKALPEEFMVVDDKDACAGHLSSVSALEMHTRRGNSDHRLYPPRAAT